MLSKKAVTPLCKQIAAEHEGWRYVGEDFKKDIGKHSTISILPLWSLHLSAQPVVWLYNKKVTKLFKIIQPDDYGGGYPISRKPILAPDAIYETQVYRKLVRNMEEAEPYIRDFFKRGLDVIEQHYNYTDEHELLENMPAEMEGVFGVGYTMSRVLLHDFDFARRYIRGELTEFPPHEDDVLEIGKMLPIWEKNYHETGSVFGKK